MREVEESKNDRTDIQIDDINRLEYRKEIN